jgi:hypothetical protein
VPGTSYRHRRASKDRAETLIKALDADGDASDERRITDGARELLKRVRFHHLPPTKARRREA